jgi:hypothetical protein
MYKVGRVYKIIYNKGNIVYVGSTFNELRYRWRDHKYHFKGYLNNKKRSELSIYPFFEEFGIENFTIILINEYCVCDKKHLEAYEQLWINKLNCINKNSSFCIRRLWFQNYYRNNKEEIKQHYQNNKEEIKLYKKQYNENNREKIKQNKKEYGKNRKDKIKEYQNKYYENNREKIKLQKKEYIENNKEKYKEYNKEYYQNNKEVIKEYQGIYRENIKDKIQEYNKRYRNNNKDKIKEYQNLYQEHNKDIINQRKQEKVLCECGTEISRRNLSTHRKTKKHNNLL